MALNIVQLRTDLGDLFDKMETFTDRTQARAAYIDDMAMLLTRFAKSGAAVGQVITAGSATMQTGQANLPIQ